ncbi:uncharacterized protein N7511_007193 [Penicillium nucicola]|uniref:uncharacterized protein n=1 Tax=Penicillium nucicola TaxID=1850975 RepID=UPI002545A9B5|nr:uncharacterized protein N7511_007193 [Penicillium nucicola]KAJ5757011.1 hypothetical protein N7511_007193 [Penicillium nucicola]
MAPTIHSAKLTLSCPLFAADFDPRNNGLLLVGGGGGEGRSGVGNKIASFTLTRSTASLLDTSRRNEVTEAVELSLSRDEDSVTSLVAAPLGGDAAGSLVTLAGINSSVAEQKKNNNQHMRAFRFKAPQKNRVLAASQDAESPDKQKTQDEKDTKSEEVITPGRATTLSQASLFRTKSGPGSSDTYQRVTRLSPWPKGKNSEKHTRIGAITTGLAASGEIVFFRVTETPSETDVIGRIQLSGNEEAEDIDFASLENDPERTEDAPGQFRVAYTNGVDIMVGEIFSLNKSSSSPEVRCVYTVPLPASGARTRPKFRALRFLSPAPCFSCKMHRIVGVVSSFFFNFQQKARASLKSYVAASSPSQQQTIIAISGSDNSIPLFTLEYGPNRGYSNFRPYSTIRDVHPFSMTKLTFSTFTAPSHPIGPEVGPQNVKLASVSMGNTVVVHTFPLSPFPTSSRTPRYVLAIPGPPAIWELIYSILILLFSISAICFAMLAFAEIRGGTPPFLGATEWLPVGLRDMIAGQYIPPPPDRQTYLDTLLAPRPEGTTDIPVARIHPDLTKQEKERLESLRSILDRVHNAGAAPADLETATPHDVSVIVRCHEAGHGAEESIFVETAVSARHNGIYDEEKLRAWTDLSEEDRDIWRQRLVDAGRWTAAEGESILLGVLFGTACRELGGAVRAGLP